VEAAVVTACILAPPPRAPVTRLTAAPTFSIVIRAYQASETIAAAVRSALGQVHRAHEVIVVDDGSTDHLARALSDVRDRITLIRKTHGGGASALNAGMQAASGDFLAILDADDAYHPNRVQALAELAMARPDLDLVTTDARFVVDGRGVGRFLAENAFVIEDQRAGILLSCFVGGWPAVRLPRLRAIGGFDERFAIAHDWDCWIRLILGGSRAGVVDEPYYDYVRSPTGLTARRVVSLWERVRMLEAAAGHPSLDANERRVVARSLRHHRTRAVLAETDAGVRRRRLLGLALARGVEPRARLHAARAATAHARER
jgi:glycosyltransferase involved in cell wall biosynthesis